MRRTCGVLGLALYVADILDGRSREALKGRLVGEVEGFRRTRAVPLTLWCTVPVGPTTMFTTETQLMAPPCLAPATFRCSKGGWQLAGALVQEDCVLCYVRGVQLIARLRFGPHACAGWQAAPRTTLRR
jgi:hypothetical protein